MIYFAIVGGTLSWKSVKQTIIASSKFISCHEATTETIWLKNFIIGPSRLHCDNSSVVFQRTIRAQVVRNILGLCV